MFSLSPKVARFTKEEGTMSETLYASSTGALSDAHKRLAPEPYDAFQKFSRKVFANGALTTKTKQLIAVARPCHAVPLFPTPKRRCARALMEAIWVSAEMRAGAAYAHSALTFDEVEKAKPSTG